MIRTLCRKAFGDAKLLLAAMTALMFFFPWFQIWLSSQVSLPAFSEFLAHALPQRWERMSPVPFSEVATPAGRAALVYVHPFILVGAVVWAIARGSDCVSGEIGRGTMEMLLAQPVRRSAVFGTQALVTIFGAAVLAIALWCGTAMGVGTLPPSEPVSPSLYAPAAFNLFALMVCLGGMSALASSWDSQRWRTVGLMAGWYVISTVLKLVGQMSDQWSWVRGLSFIDAYEPQLMVARPSEAWALFAYQDGVVAGLGLGGQQLVLIGLGLLCYLAGALVFSRREIPAPL